MTETWRDIPGFEGRYQVSDLGRVRSLDHRVRLVVHGVETARLSPGRILRPGAQASGHVTVALGRGNSRPVHQLVLAAFVGPCPAGQEVLHGNHQPADNRLDNLEYGTRSDNLKMDYRDGRRTVSPNLALGRGPFRCYA
jgi:hypothetical protein